jgi:DNA-binding Lrp family transcriptional regulator
MIKIDNFDLKLIQEIENDARQTLSQIAKTLRSSQQVISYRINSLEKRKVIGDYYTIIDITKLGYANYRTMIRLTNLNEQKHKEIINYLMKHTNVLWLVDCGGRWDLLVNFTAKNIIHYNSLLREFKNKFPKQIQNYDVLTTVEVIYFGRNYFTDKKKEIKSLYCFGRQEFETITLDKTDSQILSLISDNSRINAAEIAYKTKVSPNTAILRIKQMKKQGIIQGFKPLIHLENTPYSGYKSLVKFQNITEEREKEIIEYLKNNICVVGIIRLVGSWDFEIEFEIENKEQMFKLTREFRDKFKEVIKEFEIIPLFHEYKYNFFPGDLLKE